MDTPAQIPQRHMVVIAAAVAAVCGPGARTRQIRAVNHPVSSTWARQGRMVLQQSHDLGGRRIVAPSGRRPREFKS
jgi:hypothetical protein